MLKLKNVIKHYAVGDNKVEALKGISLEFRKNEFVSILGPSGCGKTTLLNIIGGLDRYTSGDLIINGRSTKNYTDYDWDSYRNHSIGFVFQTYNLIHHQSVLGNVELALTLSGISKSERKRRAVEALKSVGLEDQIYKRPNQLSGGQMQRVAIARALVNNPDIILADEPTGALDTETSEQIMEILKEISKERLIIMVTHNPDIANKYSTRIIRLLDGRITSDSMPYQTEDVIEKVEKNKAKKVKHKTLTSMSFFTALTLSLKNLTTKKGRTILTAFAGSIGIIGIALVLAVSNGFQNYIDKMQTDTLSRYPLTIASNTMDWTSLMQVHGNMTKRPEFPTENKVYINKVAEMLGEEVLIENDLTEDYINNVIKNGLDKNLYHAIDYQYGINMNVFKELESNNFPYFQKLPSSAWSQLAETDDPINQYNFLQTQYDILDGRLPKNKNEIVLVVNTYNQITDMDLQLLGLYNGMTDKDRESFDFNELIGEDYYIILNDKYYKYQDNKFITNQPMVIDKTIEDENTVRVEIVGIVRPNKETEIGSINGSIGYTVDLTNYILEKSSESEIVKWMQETENQTKDPLTGVDFIPNPRERKTVDQVRLERLTELGGSKKPVQINIYPVDFEAKQLIKEYLDEYNEVKKNEAINKYYQENSINPENPTEEQRKEAQKIGKRAGVYYTDLMEIVVSSMNTLINAISIVLIVFTSISLVVSSIMIGIITYISVLERTKEIGVLRSIGARKKDISRVFNAETLIVGFIAGFIGVTITVLFTIPINIILVKLIDIQNIASLYPLHGITLILISMFLTLIAGIIPSRLAAKRDPVIALRTE